MVIDATHRIISDPARLTRALLDGLRAQGLGDGHYVELLGVVVTVGGGGELRAHAPDRAPGRKIPRAGVDTPGVSASTLLPMLGFSVASALLCGLLARRRGAALIEALDAPDLLERLQRHRGAVAGSALLALLAQPVALALLVGPRALGVDVALPLLLASGLVIWAGTAAGDLPLRRAVLGETWGLAGYLGFWTRMYLALAGFWLALVAGPWLTRLWPGPSWAGGLATLALLGSWLALQDRVLRRVLRVEPLEPGELRERLERIGARARCAMPRIEVFGAPGARWCNAFALPHPTRPGVLFTRPLLERLDDDASAAVFAHELAHLEEHDAPALRRLGALLAGLCVLSALGQPLLERTSPALAAGFPVLWLIFLLAVLLLRVSRSRGHETQSDLRAIELCGDAGALIRGLTELHVANAMPRRWRAETERMSTHPSLARRIQAIRAAAGGTPACEADVAPLLVRARGDAGRALLLDARGTHWLEGLPPEAGIDDAELAEKRHSVVYGELIELHLERRRGVALLRAQTQRGEKLELPLDDADVAPLQAQLDRIDGGLAPVDARGPAREAAVALAAFCAAVGALPLLIGDGDPGVWPLLPLVLALVVMLRRRRAGVAALGALTLASGAWLASASGALTALEAAGLLGLAAGGLGCVWLARPGSEAPLEAGAPRAVAAALAALAAPGLILLAALLGRDPATTHLLAFARASTFSLLPLLGAAAALWSARGRLGPAALLLAALALAPLLLGHPGAMGRWVSDPLVAAVPAIERDEARARVRLQRTLDAPLWGLSISPGGTHAAGGAWSPTREQEVLAIVDLASGERRELEGMALALVDDARVLVVRGPAPAPRLALAPLDAPEQDLWSLALPAVEPEHWVELGARGESWWLERRGGPETLRLSGQIGDDAPARQSWNTPADAWLIAAGGPGALALHRSVGRGALEQILAGIAPTARLGWVGGDPLHSALELGCHGPTDGGPHALCAARHGPRAWLWAADTRGETLEPLARAGDALQRVWTGSRLVQLTPAALLVDDPAGARGRRLRLPQPADLWSELAVAGDTYAVSWNVDGGARRRIAVLTAD